MYKKHFILQIIMYFLFIHSCIAQNTGLDQILNSGKAAADAVKKNSPSPNPKQKSGLPPGYDNSWKIKVTLTRSVITESNLISKGACPETDKLTSKFFSQAGISTDKAVGSLNGDDFSLITNVSSDFRPFVNQLQGSYNVNMDYNASTSSCSGGTTTKFTANGSIDPTHIDLGFSYNKKTKQGSFSIHLENDYVITGNGTMTKRTSDGSSFTVDASDFGKNQADVMTGICGEFAGLNYAVSKDPVFEKMEANSPLNGERASINETKTGYEIRYSQTKVIQGGQDGWSGLGSTTYNTSVEISISDQDPIEYDAILVAVPVQTQKGLGNYDQWLPEGPSADHGEDTRGNSIAFKVMLVDKKKPSGEDPGMDFDVQYNLIPNSISKEKGYCINYPLNSNDENPDIKFDADLMKSEKATVTDIEVKSADFKGKDVIAILTSWDYGSYAKMKVLVTPKEGSPIYAHFQNDKKTEISIPKDDNNNHIADYWEDTTKIFGNKYDANWDKETQDGNSNVGDGISLYEEYRGVFSLGKHIRLDPKKKELFVINLIGDAVKPGFQAMEKAASIHIVELNKDETDPDFIVNFNSDKFQNGKQSAVKCVTHNFIDPDENDKKNGATQGDGVMGLAIARNYSSSDEPLINSPKDCLEYRINGNRLEQTDNVIKNVAHELGHACGLKHHGDNVPDLKFAKILHQASSYDSVYIYNPEGVQVYKAGAKNLTASVYLPTNNDDMGVPNCTAAGNVRCFMTYNQVFEYVYKEIKQSNNTIYQFTMSPFGAKSHHLTNSFDPSQYMYCKDGAGTVWNKNGNLFGDAQSGRGNCISEFKILDY